jgi:hypothetical protein
MYGIGSGCELLKSLLDANKANLSVAEVWHTVMPSRSFCAHDAIEMHRPRKINFTVFIVF